MELIHKCISNGEPTEGGLITGLGTWKSLLSTSNADFGLGESGTLMLEMKAYKPKVRCINPRGQASPPEDCNEVYDSMLLSEIVTDIRHTRQSASDMEVPYVVQPGRPISPVSSFQCCELSLIQ